MMGGRSIHPSAETPFDIRRYIEQKRCLVEEWLAKCTPELASPESVYGSVRYSVFSGGKRFRPVLACAVCELLNGSLESLAPFAVAVEWVHTYSLIHDDLPCMDDDSLRRGRPTNHKVYGEAIALLAGDALLTGAFGIVASTDGGGAGLTPLQRIEGIRILAQAAGLEGMVGGQVMDMEAQGTELSGGALEELHSRKTGALIRASAALGALAGGGSTADFSCIDRYSHHLGLAFQIVDDVLDVAGDEQELGKAVGSDSRCRKATYVSLYGVAAATAMASEHAFRACESLERYGDRAAPLAQLAYYVVDRRS